jgi:hypothetical protein
MSCFRSVADDVDQSRRRRPEPTIVLEGATNGGAAISRGRASSPGRGHDGHLRQARFSVCRGVSALRRAGGDGHLCTASGHRWWNAGTSDLRCTGWATPPDNVEYILTAIFDSTKRSERRRPNIFDAAFLLTRYGSEMVMLEIPAVVQKVAFPVLVAVGRMLGKYDKYKDAPEPARQSHAGSRHTKSAVQQG